MQKPCQITLTQIFDTLCCVQLNKFAEDWAKTIAKRDRMEHRPNNEYGENIYAKWHSKPNHTIQGDEAVESWYSEISDHTFGREPSSLATGEGR